MISIAIGVSVIMLNAGGILLGQEQGVGIAFIVASPLPVLLYKYLRYEEDPEPEPPKQQAPTEDPVAPTPDEPSAV